MGRNFSNKFERVVWGSGPCFSTPQSSAINQWFGRTAVTSTLGGVGVQVACPRVTSDSLINLTPYMTGPAAPTVNLFAGLCVRSIAPGSYFNVGAINSFSYSGSFTLEVGWWIARPS